MFPYLLVVLIGFGVVATIGTTESGPRVSRRARLVDLIAAEDQRVGALRQRLDTLQAQIAAFEESASRGQRDLGALRAQIDRLGTLYGTTDVAGPAVVVELRDSSLRESPTGDPNDLVIHEQDIQAVVNSLWGAGAEAMSVNGERITAASAVRCVGNTLLLHGSVHSPPYRIVAIGETGSLVRGLEEDPLARAFKVFAEEFKLGFGVTVVAEANIPAFRGLIAANHARAGAR